MSLSIECRRRKQFICPKCGEIVGHTDSDEISFGGRVWYPLLEKLGYYVPHDQLTEDNDWYGKDMVLTSEQMDDAFRFARVHSDAYGAEILAMLIALVKYENDQLVINADW